jgi:hypothetical protein
MTQGDKKETRSGRQSYVLGKDASGARACLARSSNQVECFTASRRSSRSRPAVAWHRRGFTRR